VLLLKTDIFLYGEQKIKRTKFSLRWIILVESIVEVLRLYVSEIMRIIQLEFAVPVINLYLLSIFD